MQRRGDVVRMGPQHIRGGLLHVRQQKTGAPLQLPIFPELQEAIDAMPNSGRHLTFLVTASGKPFSPAGFTNWFRDVCTKAGLRGFSAHGLRKASLTRLAEAGCSVHEIAAFSGHKTLSEIAHYTRSVEQAALAREAMAKARTKLSKSMGQIVKTEKWPTKTTAEKQDGGPGRTRTSNQAVMSAVTSSEISAKIGVSEHVRDRLFAFGCDVLLVFRWSVSALRCSPQSQKSIVSVLINLPLKLENLEAHRRPPSVISPGDPSSRTREHGIYPLKYQRFLITAMPIRSRSIRTKLWPTPIFLPRPDLVWSASRTAAAPSADVIVGRPTASQIASASAASFLFRFI